MMGFIILLVVINKEKKSPLYQKSRKWLCFFVFVWLRRTAPIDLGIFVTHTWRADIKRLCSWLFRPDLLQCPSTVAEMFEGRPRCCRHMAKQTLNNYLHFCTRVGGRTVRSVLLVTWKVVSRFEPYAMTNSTHEIVAGWWMKYGITFYSLQIGLIKNKLTGCWW